MNIRNLLLLIILTGMMQACNLPKLARKEGPLLYKNKLVVREKKESRMFSSDLDGYIKQRPNKRPAGTIRLGLRFYKMGSNFPNTRMGRLLQTKMGESPVILDSNLISSSIRGMRGFLITQGYSHPEITYRVKGRLHKKQVQYFITTGEAYHIFRIENHIADRKIDSLVRLEYNESHIRLGNRLIFENLLKEKIRVNDLLRNRGYYAFNKDLVKFDVDTNLGDYHTLVGININNPEGFKRHLTYQVKNITIEIEPEQKDKQSGKDSLHLPAFSYYPNGFPLNPEIMGRVMLIEKNHLFKQENANNTFNRLNELQLFRTINLTAIPLNENTDTPGINYIIKLQPAKKYDYTIEPQAITSDQSNLVTGSSGRNYGLASQITLSNKNVFHNAEILQVTYRISVEAQRGINISNKNFFNSFESNLNVSLIFPKLLFLPKLDRRWGSSGNRSLLSATTIWEKNVNWIRNVYALGFSWQKNYKYFNQSYTPFELSYIKTSFSSQDLADQSKNDPYLQSVFSNNLVTSTRYGFVYNNASNPRLKHNIYVKWDVLELAGTLINQAYKILDIPVADSGYHTFLGVQYFQYAKTFIDMRYNRYLDENNRLASRLAIGIAVPYGNSPDYVPFDKRFFTGGANSIRAFLPRSIGPGAYDATGNLDRSGDIKLESNVELRFNILNHFIEGAIFCDAGNIWRIKDDGRKEAVFHFNEFYKQLGVGTGVGIRLNLDFLILRVDASAPVLDPRKPLGQRNVLPSYSNPGTLLRNIIFNFGVGYPF